MGFGGAGGKIRLPENILRNQPMTFNFQATVPLLRSGYDNMASSSRREAQILMILFFDWFQCHKDCMRITTFSWFWSSSLANKRELFPTAAESVVITSSVQEFRSSELLQCPMHSKVEAPLDLIMYGFR